MINADESLADVILVGGTETFCRNCGQRFKQGERITRDFRHFECPNMPFESDRKGRCHVCGGKIEVGTIVNWYDNPFDPRGNQKPIHWDCWLALNKDDYKIEETQ